MPAAVVAVLLLLAVPPSHQGSRGRKRLAATSRSQLHLDQLSLLSGLQNMTEAYTHALKLLSEKVIDPPTLCFFPVCSATSDETALMHHHRLMSMAETRLGETSTEVGMG